MLYADKGPGQICPPIDQRASSICRDFMQMADLYELFLDYISLL